MHKLSNKLLCLFIIILLQLLTFSNVAIAKGASVKGVSLNKTSDNILVGASDTLVAMITPTNAANKSVTWTSSNTGVATVDSTGKVTGIAAGTVNVTVKTVDGGYTDNCVITVTAPSISVTGVSMNKTSDNILVGASDTLVATIVPTNATNQNVTWTSSNTGVATVDSTGKVTGIAAGTVNVTVKTVDGGYTDNCVITVTASNAVTGVSLNKASDSIAVGASDTLVATITPTNATNQNVTWTSSNTGIATVDSTGKITGIAAGMVNVTVKTVDGNYTATCEVTIGVPEMVIGLNVSSTSSTQTNLNWIPMSGATSYNIYRSNSIAGSYTLIGTSTTANYSDIGLSANTRYYYEVSAVNANGEGAYSGNVVWATTLVETVTELSVYSISATQVNLFWNVVNGATSYNIYRSTSVTGTFTLIGTSTTINYSDTGLTPNTTYYYKVSAVNANGEGGQSSAVTADIDLFGFSPSSNEIDLTWSPVNGAISYNIYRSMSFTGTFTLIGTSTTTSYKEIGITSSATYYYKVSAVYANGESKQSSAVRTLSALSESVGTPKIASGGNGFAFYLDSTGHVWAWGGGVLGNETTNSSSVPVQVSNLSNIVAIAGGGNTGYALDSFGHVWAWGYGSDGNLGNGTVGNSLVPVQVSNLTNIVAITASYNNAYALDSSGHVWAWGSGSFGELGNGTDGVVILVNSYGDRFYGSTTPVQVSNLSNIVAIAGGDVSTYALDNTGHVWAWGRGVYGELGIGTNSYSSKVPVRVTNLTNIVEIAGGSYKGYALDSFDQVWAWGGG
ncbi:Ig-like domain-containing protein [Desulfitobacterium sp.]|uniref:Ig-like domain-containing protein n=1 Tax=Desulfitobacterium sp. TaxID=49981 RepID=UPI002C3E7912|nr:Ig-like domain-containing protein [Desulfitobacterium sp.]HVJ49400.1 Ig-like domain-containing protein [Desulfitobacterium sp.]